MLKKLFTAFLIIAALTGISTGISLYWLIVVHPGNAIKAANLRKVLAIESPVFYNDEEHKVGVFFHTDHRQYLSYSQIPLSFVKAIVAAEDHNFFYHHGVDYPGILRALIADIRAGHIVQGGSTLTQQAAKNLFKRHGRSITGKLKELLYAWRLEYHYSKAKILEFYANQFYVSGNGRGLGVAAKYYFDKPPADLSLIESAFIAGSVKRPNYYNPFIKHSPQAVAAARRRARIRTAYVLKQMYNMHVISRRQYQRNIGRDIPFKQGRTSYTFNTVMDMVKDALTTPEVEEALVNQGIDNISTSGIKIFTTVNRGLENFSLDALRRELSRLSVRLRGYNAGKLRKKYALLAKKQGQIKFSQGAFLFGTINAVDRHNSTIKVDFLRRGKADRHGLIDRQGLMPLITSLTKFNHQRWSTAGRKEALKFLKTLRPGDPVYVRIRDIDTVNGTVYLSLEKYPDLQGGIMILKDGTISAMIGGSENRFFNRATRARRLMGSETKPLLYTAALQLGWNTADLLNNKRNAFVFRNQVYIPKPDHKSPYNWVSMNWAGTKSENVASVWLLYHLCDRLSPLQFKDILNGIHLNRGPEESYQEYRSRIRDHEGILVNNEALRGLAFQRAVRAMEPDLLFAGKNKDYDILRQLHYSLSNLVTKKHEKAHEDEIRRNILRHSYLRQKEIYSGLMALREQVERTSPGSPWLNPDLYPALKKGFRLYYNPAQKRYDFTDKPPGTGWQRLNTAGVSEKWSEEGQDAAFWGNIRLDGLLSAASFKQLKDDLEAQFTSLKKLPPYGPEILYQLRDFRILAGLKYLIALCHQMGIKSNLQPVLSFPLGSNVTTTLDMARAYESIITGYSYHTGRQGSAESLMLIKRIENSDGDVIYTPAHSRKRIIDPRTSLAVSDILRHVVRYGTGRYAYNHIKLSSMDTNRGKMLADLDLHLPLLGKTGTANDFRNAAFVGYVPSLGGRHKALSLKNGTTIAVYTGFDNNQPMVRHSSHMTGSQAALPLWSLLAAHQLSTIADKVDLGALFFAGAKEIPLIYPDLGQIHISTAAGNKIMPSGDEVLQPYSYDASDKTQIGPDMVSFGTITPSGQVHLNRYFRPFWRNADDKTQ
ncbi:transglycosylase domain-containing protein [Desulfobacterota bacterium M19]